MVSCPSSGPVTRVSVQLMARVRGHSVMMIQVESVTAIRVYIASGVRVSHDKG